MLLRLARSRIVEETKLNIKHLILASQSKIRAEQLAKAGIPFACHPSNFDETTVSQGSPRDVALGRAVGKANEVAKKFPDTLVLGADQVMEFEGEIYGKVKTASDARNRLAKISGAEHFLHSAFVLVRHGAAEEKSQIIHQDVVTVALTFHNLKTEEINSYVETGEWRGSCGCYQFENQGIKLVQSVDGDWDAILGMPVLKLLNVLRGLG